MPWVVRKAGNKFNIVKKTTGEVVGTSDSKEKAQASVRARYASEGGQGGGGDMKMDMHTKEMDKKHKEMHK